MTEVRSEDTLLELARLLATNPNWSKLKIWVFFSLPFYFALLNLELKVSEYIQESTLLAMFMSLSKNDVLRAFEILVNVASLVDVKQLEEIISNNYALQSLAIFLFDKHKQHVFRNITQRNIHCFKQQRFKSVKLAHP